MKEKNINSLRGDIPSVFLARMCPALGSQTWMCSYVQMSLFCPRGSLRQTAKSMLWQWVNPVHTEDSLITEHPIGLITQRTGAQWALANSAWLSSVQSSTVLFPRNYRNSTANWNWQPLLQVPQHNNDEIPIVERTWGSSGSSAIVTAAEEQKGRKKEREREERKREKEKKEKEREERKERKNKKEVKD